MELSSEARVKLSDDYTERLWEEVERRGGVKEVSQSLGHSRSKMYNWKNKNSFLPIDFVTEIAGDELGDEIKAFKGKSRSNPIRNPSLPLDLSDELLCRIEFSVSINENGTPMYMTNDLGNLRRFQTLLDELGEVPYNIYTRDSRFQLNFPGYLYTLFQEISHGADKTALIDEKGNVNNGEIYVEGTRIAEEDYPNEIYNRKKKLKLALSKEKNEVVREMLSKEAKRAERTLDSVT
ncbi:MAG: hypothetical protein BRC28_00605 [Nanohaloarchaea archaeon SW_4_43_9]|nr:MAG: hypothetical protein BRC28_00605 [Nanohaloarchaea archaeon SW_4_43_9]